MREGVSVVIPCYNAAKFLRETLDSVLAQDYEGPLEVLVADDDSTDGSAEIIESYGSPVILLPKPPEVGRSAAIARNRCLAAATQPLVAFLDADDLWFPSHLSALAEVMQARPELGLAFDSGYHMSEDGSEVWPRDPATYPLEITPDYLILGCQFGPGQVMVRSSVFERVGLSDESLRHAEEYDLWLRIVEAFPAVHVPNDGFKYRQHGNQKSLKPTLWSEAARVFDKARHRYPYKSSSIRKRRAILNYRFSQIAFREQRRIRAICLLACAAALDPVRAAHEFRRRWIP